MTTITSPEVLGVRLAMEPAGAKPKSHRMQNIGILGAGNVVQDCLVPALLHGGLSCKDVLLCSIEEASPIPVPSDRYCHLDAGEPLPISRWDEMGFLDETLWYVATPPAFHVDYALSLASFPGCRVAIESPLSDEPDSAERLLNVDDADAHSVDHKLFTREVIDMIDHCREHPRFLAGVHTIEGVFHETSGFAKARSQDDGIGEIQSHLFIVSLAMLRAAGRDVQSIKVDTVHTSRYLPDPTGFFASATAATASRVEGTFVTDTGEIRFRFTQAKAAARNVKSLRFLGKAFVQAAVDLSESDWQPHSRVLAELFKPVPDMRHTLADAVSLVRAIANARAMAELHPPYPFASAPDFLDLGARI